MSEARGITREVDGSRSRVGVLYNPSCGGMAARAQNGEGVKGGSEGRRP